MRLSPKYAVVALVALAACTPALSQPAGGCTGPTEQGDVRSAILATVSYTHLTLPTTPYV